MGATHGEATKPSEARAERHRDSETQSHVTAAQAGLAIRSEPSRAGCACREAIRLGERSELRSSRKAPRECREVLELGILPRPQSAEGSYKSLCAFVPPCLCVKTISTIICSCSGWRARSLSRSGTSTRSRSWRWRDEKDLRHRRDSRRALRTARCGSRAQARTRPSRRKEVGT